ncbi:MAG: ATPase [Verrucomicrobia bacterium]|nr:ATPase [Verrucomicrobiota bacterium]
MKRFYDKVEICQEVKGYFITLDGKNIRTPSRQILKLSTQPLAQAIADEWREQIDEIRPAGMPLTQLANTAIDQTRPHRTRVIEQVAAYAQTDLLCYRAAMPPDLAEQQAASWQPLLDWCKAEYDSDLAVTTDLAPLEQSKKSLLGIYIAVAQLDDFCLTGLSAATAASGSVIIGLALLRRRLDPDEACSLAQLDEQYQSNRWGEDPDATVQRDSVRRAISVAASFMAMSQAG